MKKLSILLAILLTLCTAFSSLPVEKVIAQSPSTLAPPELYAGTSNPGHVWKYMGGTEWTRISPTFPPLGSAVLSLVKYNHKLYAGVIANDGSTGQVWEYDGDNWTCVGPWLVGMDDQVASLAVYKSELYAGTGWNGMRLYRYNGSVGNWTRVVDYTPWHGTRSLYVWNNYLLMGDLGYDYFGHWDGTIFEADQMSGGSCIYDYEEYGNYVYAAAYHGRLWRSSDGMNWGLAPGCESYYDGNMWELERFGDLLYMSYDNGQLWRSDGSGRGTCVYTAPDGIIAMETDGQNLYLGTGGEAGYYGETGGTANIYKYDGTNVELISDYDQFGAGVQVLYSPQKAVVGYMWQNLSVLESKQLTHAVESFAWLDSRVEGYLNTASLNKDTFVQAAEARDMIPLVSIQQASEDNKWSGVISDTTKRGILISSIVDLVAEAGYKGVDIDLEGLTKTDVDGYRHFVQELRESLDADPRTNSPRRLLMVTVQGYALDKGYYSIGNLTAYADYVMLMGYDFTKYSDPSGPWDQQGKKLGYTVKRLLNEIVAYGYPAERVIYLLPFYTRWSSGALSWSELVQIDDNQAKIASENVTDYYLEKFVKLQVGTKKNKPIIEQVWVTDPTCITKKVRAALFENNITLPDGSSGNIGGVGAWQIGQDASDSELTKALWDAAHDR